MHFRVWRDIHVDHGFQLGNIQPACGDVCGDQNRAAAVGELNQHLVAFALFQFAMQGECDKACILQHLHQRTALLACIAKGQRADRTIMVEQLHDGGEFLFVVDFIKPLADFALRVLFGERDLLRLAQELSAQAGNALGIGGGKQQGLPLLGAGFGDAGNIVIEPHIQHAIRFIQHQCGELGQVKAAALEVIHDAPRGTDDDMCAVFQAGHLRSHGAATA